MLQKILSENFERTINDQEEYDFTIDADGVYSIIFSARCKNWLQNFRRLFDDDNLALQIDNYLFAEVKGKKREFSSAGSWNGNELKNKTKEVSVILPLKKGVHAIKFWAGGQPFFKKVEIYKIGISGGEKINLAKSDFAKFDGFGDVIFKNLTVGDLTIKARAEKGDRLELRVDGRTQLNSKYKRYAKWFWYGQELQGAEKEYKGPYCLGVDVHSLEFRGQGQPTIESISFAIQDKLLKFKIGKVKLYEDIIISDLANLRSTPHLKNNQILAQLKNGDEVEILEERVEGDYYEGYSEIWHEIIYQDKKGFILSSFVEIEGQEREKIIDLIKEKCWQYGADANIMLAIAARESHFKPFARSSEPRYGIFQLGADAMADVKINDSYDFFQNIDGGIRYYKIIEKQFTGRGDILKWRLIAWHDGPTVTRKKKTINYDELSSETKSFLKNVLANMEKRDWFHIISLPLSILIVISSFITAYSFQLDQKYADAGYSFGQIVSPMLGPENKNASASLYSEGITSFPAVFLDKKNDEVVFANSEKVEVGRIDIKLLSMDSIFGTPSDFIGASGKNLTFIEPKCFEHPKNIFYFIAATSYSCGTANCTWVLYSFDANKNELRIVDENLFGAGIDFYPSLDFKKLAVVSVVEGGFCTNGSYLAIIDLASFKKQELSDYLDDKFSSRLIRSFSWKNDKEVEFNVEYRNCLEPRAKKTIWLYNIDEGKRREIKSEIFDLNLSG